MDRVFVPGSFERRAVGSASIAQVHRARLRTGEEVAVKVQKPWIKRQVGMDLAVFQVVTYCTPPLSPPPPVPLSPPCSLPSMY